jgi:hypothetical protein
LICAKEEGFAELIGSAKGSLPTLIRDKFVVWERECDERFDTLKANEEELNRIFINIYGLQDELTPEVIALILSS